MNSLMDAAMSHLYKVVLVDNLDRDFIPDKNLVSIKGDIVDSENLTLEEAKALAKRYNDSCPINSDWFAMVKPQSYKLRTMEDFY